MNLEPGMEWMIVSGSNPADETRQFRRVDICFKTQSGVKTHRSPVLEFDSMSPPYELSESERAIIEKWFNETVLPDYRVSKK